jgi:hypothetical protein
MNGEPIEDEFDTEIPVDEGDAEEEPRDDAAADGSLYDEPRMGGGPDLTDSAQDEHPTPTTRS